MSNNNNTLAVIIVAAAAMFVGLAWAAAISDTARFGKDDCEIGRAKP